MLVTVETERGVRCILPQTSGTKSWACVSDFSHRGEENIARSFMAAVLAQQLHHILQFGLLRQTHWRVTHFIPGIDGCTVG